MCSTLQANKVTALGAPTAPFLTTASPVLDSVVRADLDGVNYLGRSGRFNGFCVHRVVLLVGADKFHVDDLQLVGNCYDQPVVKSLLKNIFC